MATMETHLSHDQSHTGPMNPVTARPTSFEVWQAVVAPGDVFRHPREVLAHPTLSRAQKRAVLASWASDAQTVENTPGLRCLTGCRAEPVSVDAVLAALAELDEPPARSPSPSAAVKAPGERRLRPLSNLRRYIRPGHRDDDDPPPCPAAILPRPRTPPSAPALAVCA